MLKLIQTCQITVLTDTEGEMYINLSIQKDKQILISFMMCKKLAISF